MNALVTGASGFIGSHLARRLAADGWAVTGTGRDLSKVGGLERGGVELAHADLLDGDRMRELVEGRDVVFHCAAWLGGDEEKAVPVNVGATEALVRSAAEAGVGRFVHVSSISVYGIPGDRTVVTEEWPLVTGPAGGGPVSTYARTKALGEVRAREAAAELGIDLVVLRPGMVWGPGSSGWSLRVAGIVCAGKPILVGDGSGHFHAAYVDNVVDALLLAATHPGAVPPEAVPGGAFNVTDEPLTWREYAGHYGALCGVEPKAVPRWLARALAALSAVPGVHLPIDRVRYAMATRRHVYSADRLRERLGWTPRVGVAGGMERTASWLREEGVV